MKSFGNLDLYDLRKAFDMKTPVLEPRVTAMIDSAVARTTEELLQLLRMKRNG
jgi:hypothetical protein